ncbi:hypothetical protein [Ramlibacter pallidus]|uniref:Uncharacterized protein n=1 Tax=Ramlibacter pallidus TaxID=2780087 RepID=A0ABR9S6K0_9BURK|nr:hypothetical protein [Ramlibacter pallidus]MBE7368917.1 hypothetical protein [Ramlibacter pallidus]
MDTPTAPPDNARELPLPGTRSGEGTQTLWQHMARDEQQKTSNRGAGQREALASQQAVHPGRRATDGR